MKHKNFSTHCTTAGFEDERSHGPGSMDGQTENDPQLRTSKEIRTQSYSCIELSSANNLEDSGSRFPSRASRKVIGQHHFGLCKMPNQAYLASCPREQSGNKWLLF